jgi:hypothetical protein
MEDQHRVLSEVRRALRDGGYLIISDIYIRAGSLQAPGNAPCEACFFHAIELTRLSTWLGQSGFSIALLEDRTRELKELMANIILKHGSMQRFWELVWGRRVCNEAPGGDVRLGYFLIVARLTKGAGMAVKGGAL